MSFFQTLLLSLSLAADAFAVAIWAGISQKRIYLKQAFLMALCFWVFQAIMPLIGYSLASLFAELIRNYDHWIAFLLLGYLGGNMIYEWMKKWEEETIKNIFSIKSLLTLGVATSIDALAVWVSLTATDNSIYSTALLIGIVTFILTFIGVKSWQRFGVHIGKRAEIIWWIILFGIGTKILLEHTL